MSREENGKREHLLSIPLVEEGNDDNTYTDDRRRCG
jgi:hypothetical protein